MCLKTSKEEKSLIRLFAFLCFCLGVFVPFVLLLGFVKNIKTFKITLMTSFTLLLNSSYYKHKFLQLQSFSIITILFNHHNLFQLSQSFSIITIFFSYHNLLYQNLFYHSLFLISLQLVTLSL